MTLSLRNTFIKVTLTISVTLFLMYILSFLYVNQDNLFSMSRIIEILNEQNNSSVEDVTKSLHWTVLTAAILFVFSITSTLFLYHYFKKKISPEIFFFILFVLSLSLQSIRLFQFQLLLLNVSPFFGVVNTRVFYFFKLFGVFCFFAASLFPVGIKVQKFGTILISLLLISFTISALMPIDSTQMNRSFLYNISDSFSILLVTISIKILTIINLSRVTISTKSKNYILILIASVFIIIGEELLLTLYVPLLGIFMIVIGSIIYSRSIYNYYLWV